jgi:phosphomevalonate kinase
VSTSAPATPTVSAPGKLMLAGEYAVLEGAPAVVMAIGRRVVARVAPQVRKLSPFLAAARDVIADERGADSAAARAAGAIAVDSGALALADGRKLGLGSSAAATAAAIGCALASGGEEISPTLVHPLAHRAHRLAQGDRGSGADVASACHGGLLAIESAPGPAAGAVPRLRALPRPRSLQFAAAFTGRSAHTPTLLDAAAAARSRDPARFAAAMSGLRAASELLAAALERDDAAASVAALERGAGAVTELDALVDAELVLPTHRLIAASARAHGGAAKPTGAAGGDLAIAAFPEPGAATAFIAELKAHAILAFEVAPAEGVRLEI